MSGERPHSSLRDDIWAAILDAATEHRGELDEWRFNSTDVLEMADLDGGQRDTARRVLRAMREPGPNGHPALLEKDGRENKAGPLLIQLVDARSPEPSSHESTDEDDEEGEEGELEDLRRESRTGDRIDELGGDDG